VQALYRPEPWMESGACQRTDPDLFFHPEGERGDARRARAEAARQVCFDCPVLEECRRYALERREAFGTWGGLSEDEREAIWTGDRAATRRARERARYARRRAEILGLAAAS
jgi:WhiB family transcriptional regulator, redox-sensing transcriptional regulator